MEGSRKRATDGKVDGGKETGGHSKDKKSRNQHEHRELNNADMAGAGAASTKSKAGDAIFDRLLDDEEKKCRDHVDAITDRLNDVCKLSRDYIDHITSVRTDISDNNLVPLLKEAETLITECKTSTSGIPHKCNVKSCVFVRNKTLSDHLQSVGAIGELVPETFPCLSDDIKIRVCNVSYVTGLLVLADGRLLLTDSYNDNIKLFDVNHKLVSHVKLQSAPTDIVEIDGGQVAVCLAFNKKIQLVSVSGILTLGRIIETPVKCHSVTRCGDNLAAVVLGSPDIVEIDMRGRKVRTVWTSPDGYLEYIIHNTRGELITTGGGGAVTRVTRDGVVLAQYQGDNLANPRGLTVHPDGSIYVCGWKSDNIHHITADCTRSIEVFGDGQISEPRRICYNQHNNSLYVSHGDFSEQSCACYIECSRVSSSCGLDVCDTNVPQMPASSEQHTVFSDWQHP